MPCKTGQEQEVAGLSSPDSFIDEVTEEVRRDRLFAIFRKYGWIGVLAILLIVGGASYVEWQKARVVARAQAFGDAVLDATDLASPMSAARQLPPFRRMPRKRRLRP